MGFMDMIKKERTRTIPKRDGRPDGAVGRRRLSDGHLHPAGLPPDLPRGALLQGLRDLPGPARHGHRPGHPHHQLQSRSLPRYGRRAVHRPVPHRDQGPGRHGVHVLGHHLRHHDGAGQYLVGAFACFGVGLLYFVISLFHKKLQSPYLLVLRYEPDKTANIAKALKTLPRHRVKSRTMTRDGAELTLEISLKDNEMATIDQFLQVDGVLDASLVSYEGEFGL